MILRFKRIDLMGPRHPYRKNIKPYLDSFILSNVNPFEVKKIGRLNFWDTSSSQTNIHHISRNWLHVETTGNSRFFSNLRIRRESDSLCCVVTSGESEKLVPSDDWLEVSMPCQLLIPTHPSVQNAGSSLRACSYAKTRYVVYSIELMTKSAHNSIKLPKNIKYKSLNNSNTTGILPVVQPKRIKENPRSRAARLSQEEYLKMYKQQGGRCALCGVKFIKKVGGRGASLWHTEADHSVPHALRKGNEKPDQLLCPTCHSLKSAIEWHTARDRTGDGSRAKLSYREFRKHLDAIHEVSNHTDNENELVNLHTLISSGNWRPNINITHKKLADIVGKFFNRGHLTTHHPVHNPQRLPVLHGYDIFPSNSVPLKLYEDVNIKKLIHYFGTDPGTRFYSHNKDFGFSKDGKQVTMSAQGVNVATLEFDGRRGEIERIEWAGGRKVNVYVKSTKSK